MSTLVNLLIVMPIYVLAIVIHEVSHGWVANRLGDPTAKHLGRLSLNPLRHIDPLGTVALPLLLTLTGSPVVFGWAKPVPIDYRRLGDPKRDLIWVGLAGPAANVLLALLMPAAMHVAAIPPHSWLGMIGFSVILMNLVLAVFNLIPIPPLDGSRVLVGLLPYRFARWMAMIEPFGFLILIGLLYVGLIDRLIWPVVVRVLRVLGMAGP